MQPWRSFSRSSCGTQLPLLLEAASLKELFSAGMLPLTALLYRGAGAVLLGAEEQAALYIGLVCGGVSLMLCRALWRDDAAAACLPGAVLLFLPCAFAPMMACGLLCLWLQCRGHGRLSLGAAFIGAMLHPFGWGMLLWRLIRRLPRLHPVAAGALGWGLCLGAAVLLRWNGWLPELICLSAALGLHWACRGERPMSGAWMALPGLASVILTLILL